MQIVEPTEKAFVLSAREKETLKAAAKIFEELYGYMNTENYIKTYSHDFEDSIYSVDDILNISEYLNEFGIAETITERV